MINSILCYLWGHDFVLVTGFVCVTLPKGSELSGMRKTWHEVSSHRCRYCTGENSIIMEKSNAVKSWEIPKSNQREH